MKKYKRVLSKKMFSIELWDETDLLLNPFDNIKQKVADHIEIRTQSQIYEFWDTGRKLQKNVNKGE